MTMLRLVTIVHCSPHHTNIQQGKPVMCRLELVAQEDLEMHYTPNLKSGDVLICDGKAYLCDYPSNKLQPISPSFLKDWIERIKSYWW